MNIAQQYIDIFRNNLALINRHSAPVLNGVREEALRRFETTGLPKKGEEAFLHTDVESFYAPDYGLNLSRIRPTENPHAIFQCAVPGLDNNRISVCSGDIFLRTSLHDLPEGVIAGSLCEAAAAYPELVGRYYGKLAQGSSDGTVTLNTAFVQDGFFLYVPRNIRIEEPLQLVNLVHGPHETLSNRRLLIILEEGAEVRLLSCDHTLDKGKFLISTVGEIFVGERATFDYYDLEESTLDTHRVASTFVRQESGSNVLVNGITLHNGRTRNNYYITLAGTDAEIQLYGMVIADKRQQVDNYTNIDHQAPRGTSNELFKYVLEDSATGVFNGRILVQPGAQKTAALQTNRNLCSSPEAHIYTQPQLEIYADDVKCNHGATVGQLDSNALFYMRSRGIPEDEARTLLKLAFTHDVIEKIRIDKLKEKLHKLVERRFRGTLDKCAGCRICQ